MTDTVPLFSVIIPTHDRADLVGEAVRSVLSQSFRDFEVIVVDDGSSDQTPEVMQEFADQVRYHRQVNQGVSAARNRGLALARGEFIAYLDSDDLWLEDKLEVYAALIRRTPCDFIFSDFSRLQMPMNQILAPSNSAIFSRIYELAGFDAGAGCHVLKGDSLVELVLGGYPFYPSTFAIRRAVHDHFRWDTAVLKSEDFNFVVKLINTLPFHYVDRPLTTIRMHETNKSYDSGTKSRVHLATLRMYRELYATSATQQAIADRAIGGKDVQDFRSSLQQGHWAAAARSLMRGLANRQNQRRWWDRLLRRS